MEEKHAREFYPTLLLLVTGFSFLLFTFLLGFIDGEKNTTFGWVGLGSFVLGLITGAATLVKRAARED